jgi:hypothetical protein
MSGLLDGMRKDNKLRPENSDRPKYDGWREKPSDSSWKRNSAIESKNTQRTVKNAPPKPKTEKPIVCIVEGCSEKVYQAGMCKPHRLQIMRDRNRANTARRRAEDKKLKELEQNAQRRNVARLCKVCGDPVPDNFTNLLCRFHFNTLQTERNRAAAADLDDQREAAMELKKKRLAKRWAKILERYEREK